MDAIQSESEDRETGLYKREKVRVKYEGWTGVRFERLRGFKQAKESLILAQDERWRRA